MTPNREDYLKLIFELGGNENIINNKQIVTGLNVSAASVSEMITKLLKEGFVTHSPYQGVQLTELGLENASSLVRKHRLWEVFLVTHLGYSWNEVHEEAEVLEHVTSEELTNRLDHFLDHPKVCPHGGIIPASNQPIHERSFKVLAEYSTGTRVQIKRVLDEKELLDYLASVDLTIDEIFTIKEIGIYEGPITLTNGKKTIQVNFKAAHNIFVEALDPDLKK